MTIHPHADGKLDEGYSPILDLHSIAGFSKTTEVDRDLF